MKWKEFGIFLFAVLASFNGTRVLVFVLRKQFVYHFMFNSFLVTCSSVKFRTFRQFGACCSPFSTWLLLAPWERSYLAISSDFPVLLLTLNRSWPLQISLFSPGAWELGFRKDHCNSFGVYLRRRVSYDHSVHNSVICNNSVPWFSGNFLRISLQTTSVNSVHCKRNFFNEFRFLQRVHVDKQNFRSTTLQRVQLFFQSIFKWALVFCILSFMDSSSVFSLSFSSVLWHPESSHLNQLQANQLNLTLVLLQKFVPLCHFIEQILVYHEAWWFFGTVGS